MPRRAGKIIPPAIALLTLGVFPFSRATDYRTLLLSQLVVSVGASTGFVGAGYISGQWFFSTQIGTSAALVNGIMLIAGGIMISRPGARIGLALERGLAEKSLELVQYAA